MKTQQVQQAEQTISERKDAIVSLVIDDAQALPGQIDDEALTRLRAIVQQTVEVCVIPHQPRGFWQDEVFVVQLFNVTHQSVSTLLANVRELLDNVCLMPGQENPSIGIAISAILHSGASNTILAAQPAFAALKTCRSCGGNCTEYLSASNT